MVFREMNRAPDLDGLLRAALQGLESLIPGCRARLVPQSYELMLHVGGLDAYLVFLDEDEHEVLRDARESGQTVVDSRGVDHARIHCCIVPFRGGLVYLDAREPFTSDAPTIAGMVTQQLAANLGGMSVGLTRTERGSLKDLRDEIWFHNQLNEYEAFSVVSFQVDGYEKLKTRHGWETAESILREFVSFLGPRLKPADLLARAQVGEFLLLTERAEKAKLAAHWRQALKGFESAGVARRYRLTVSAGLAVYPEDGLPRTVKDLAQMACNRAATVGGSVLTVAAPSLNELSFDGDPRSRFDARCGALVDAAVKECQVRKRLIDPPALLWGLCAEESELSVLLRSAGLQRPRLRESLQAGEEPMVTFSESATSAFSLALEFAHRAGRKSVRIGELMLACLSEPQTETVLRECGLQYGKLLAALYREGHFAENDTLLVGEFSTGKTNFVGTKPLPKRAVTRALERPFGEHFTSELWALLAVAQEEARWAYHDLGFEHLYIAVLRAQDINVESARAALKLLALDHVPVDFSRLSDEVRRFLQELDADILELTVYHVAQALRQHPQIAHFISLINEKT